MSRHSLKSWVIATRPWSFPASTMPVVVTLAYLFWMGYGINWMLGLYALVNIVLFHSAGNTWSDYYDFKCGVDREDTMGGRSITSGEFSPREIRTLSLALFVVAALSGLALVLVCGITVLWIGIAGFLLTVLYPWLKYRALGDVDIFLTYGVLPMLGTSFVATGEIVTTVLWLSLPVGLITVGILHINNVRDVQHDRKAEIKTFAMQIGIKYSLYAYCFELLFPFVWVVVCIVAGTLPLCSLLAFVALKPAIDNVRSSLQYASQGSKAIASHDELTAKLQLLFSLLLSVSLFIASLL